MNVVYIILALVICVLIYAARQRSNSSEQSKQEVQIERERAQQIINKEVDFIKQSMKLAYRSEYCYDILKKRVTESLVNDIPADQRLICIAGVMTVAYMQGETFEDANQQMQQLATRLLTDNDLKEYIWTLMAAFGVTISTMKNDKLLNILIIAANPEWLNRMVEKETDA